MNILLYFISFHAYIERRDFRPTGPLAATTPICYTDTMSKYKDPRANFSISLPMRLAVQLQTLAEQRDKTLSAVIAEVCGQYLAAAEAPAAPAQEEPKQ